MTFKEYMAWVASRVDTSFSPFADKASGARHLAAYGLSGETGEVLELHKKELFHGRTIDRQKLRNELGDVLWYFALAIYANGFTLEELIEDNFAKLCERHGVDNSGMPHKVIVSGGSGGVPGGSAVGHGASDDEVIADEDYQRKDFLA